MDEKIYDLEDFISSCFESKHDSEELRRNLEALELLITPDTIGHAESLAVAYWSIPTIYNAEKSYYYYQIYYSQNGYSIGWHDQNMSPPHYCGPIGDFRNEDTVSYLVVELGFEKCQKIDSNVRHWLDNNGLEYCLVRNEEE